MDTKPGSGPRFSEDRQWRWDGSQWLPAGPAQGQGGPRPNPRWAQGLFAANRKGWRWMVLVTLAAAVVIAGYGVITGWEVPGSGLATAVAISLFVFAVATSLALLAFSRDECRNLAGDAALPEVLQVAARGVRWSSVFGIGISVLLFANCSAGVSSGDLVHGSASNPAQFWSLAALEMLPLWLAIALSAGLATAAQVLVRNGRLIKAKKVASLGLWSAAMIAAVALVTTVIALGGGVSECSFVSTASACAAGVGGLTNPAAIGSLLLIVPYLNLIKRSVSAAPANPDG
jgi:hypothetical protein